MHIVCNQCLQINRIAAEKLDANPICGRCKQRLFGGPVADLTESQFYTHIHKNDMPVLVDFWAPWCGPCKAMAPVYEQAARLLEPGVRLVKLNTENEPNLSQQFAIRSIPTIILFKGGKEHNRLSGALDVQNLVAWVNQNL